MSIVEGRKKYEKDLEKLQNSIEYDVVYSQFILSPKFNNLLLIKINILPLWNDYD